MIFAIVRSTQFVLCFVVLGSFSCLLTYNGIQNLCNLFIWWFLNSIGVEFHH